MSSVDKNIDLIERLHRFVEEEKLDRASVTPAMIVLAGFYCGQDARNRSLNVVVGTNVLKAVVEAGVRFGLRSETIESWFAGLRTAAERVKG